MGQHKIPAERITLRHGVDEVLHRRWIVWIDGGEKAMDLMFWDSRSTMRPCTDLRREGLQRLLRRRRPSCWWHQRLRSREANIRVAADL